MAITELIVRQIYIRGYGESFLLLDKTKICNLNIKHIAQYKPSFLALVKQHSVIIVYFWRATGKFKVSVNNER